MKEEKGFLIMGLEAVGNVVPFFPGIPQAWQRPMQIAFGALSIATLAYFVWRYRMARKPGRRKVSRKAPRPERRAFVRKVLLSLAAILAALVMLEVVENLVEGYLGLGLVVPFLLVALAVGTLVLLARRGAPQEEPRQEPRALQTRVLLSLAAVLAALVVLQLVENVAAGFLGLEFPVLPFLLVAFAVGMLVLVARRGGHSGRALALLATAILGGLILSQLIQNIISSEVLVWELSLVGMLAPIAGLLVFWWLKPPQREITAMSGPVPKRARRAPKS